MLTGLGRGLMCGRWHPLGDKIPRFSPSHCSTGTVLLVQALLLCQRTRLFGFHACSCQTKCADEQVSARNHYWDKKETPKFDLMLSRCRADPARSPTALVCHM